MEKLYGYGVGAEGGQPGEGNAAISARLPCNSIAISLLAVVAIGNVRGYMEVGDDCMQGDNTLARCRYQHVGPLLP